MLKNKNAIIYGAGSSLINAVACWQVDNLNCTSDTLTAVGAKHYEGITDRNGGKISFVTASVIAPFETILEMMFNHQFLDTLKTNTPDQWN
ncbi:hypothetical protein [Flagellimonas halotolerans]|uniref:Uncharacterized protein n=1 Tax=Flagellimonas halotolerans TaxID=3112164 RepID=A0ABU6IRK8_9FLAO|nr:MULTISPECIES: hypothetical protein [unclassified Allomuricauda]MEC3965835.1 hypothetical protein [Muricauda sp. SYSU M86414]MEC4265699.1 hypothetical protein [Muricauda sp. SYSU M84420]